MRVAQGKIIDYASPVNWNWAGNSGLYAWYLALPGLMGGAKWRDLTSSADLRVGRHGTLTSITQGATHGWQNTSRPGGYGDFKFAAGAVGWIATPFSAADIFTIACWVYQTSLTGYQVIYDGSARAFFINGGKLDWYSSGDHLGTATLSANKWNHICLSFKTDASGTAYSYYINGVLDASFTTASSGMEANFTIGNRASNAALLGRLDDFRLYHRALSANEVSDLYRESAAGYPRGIRRIRAFTLGSPGSPGVLNIAGTSTVDFKGAFGAVLNIAGTSTTDFIGLGGTTAVLNIAGTSTALFNGTTNLRAPALIPWDEQDPRKRSRYHQQVVALLLNSLIRSGGIVEDQLGVFRLGYQPANNADWSLNQPRTVAEALDRIAALIGPIP